jgi:hypothetical protein
MVELLYLLTCDVVGVQVGLGIGSPAGVSVGLHPDCCEGLDVGSEVG